MQLLGARIALFVATALVWAAVSTLAEEPCHCPESIGAHAGSQPLIRSAPGGMQPGLVACGYLEKRRPDGDVIATEFEVFRCGAGKSLLTFSALETCQLHSSPERLVVTQLARWPFGANWTWVDERVWEYVFTARGGDTPSKRMVLEPRKISSREAAEALDAYAKCQGAGRACFQELFEEVIGEILVAALGGDSAAQKALFAMPGTLELDSHPLEEYTEAIGLYDAYAANTGKVPKRPGA